MPYCENCEAFVPESVVKVLYPQDVEIVACPKCPGSPREGFAEYIADQYRE